ncbi:MAG: chemotaxis protein CheW [Kineosporiaceae bacterium]|nr:chemotaxis protein CheW [Kineosporiaceae bacterium]MBK7622106.1 chemotaxis protein CheW [Kineosporiaceae bacterium]MBK8074416.1 chemotaxis protein CheW [Kineosporiaceae bacterium]
MSQLSTFHVGKYLFGVDVALVQEVVRLNQITPVPLARPEIAGLINLRGAVLTAIDLRARLGLPPADGTRERVNVVVRVDDEPVSLLVDEIGGVLEVSQVPFESTPSTVDEKVRDLLLGAYTLPDRLLLALNAERVLDVPVEARA